jgi:transposase
MRPPSCAGCLERDEVIAALQQRVTDLEARLRDLEAQLRRNATNSSVPPSANPPRAPKPVVKKATGRRRGAQPDHPPQQRLRLPPERVRHVIPLLPPTCDHCRHPLPPQPGPDDPEPSWHQFAELPKVQAVVTEFQGHTRTCPGCGHQTHAAIPAVIKAHSFGPRLTAALTYFSGAQHLGKRAVAEVAETLFGVPVALGTVAAMEQETSAALAAPHAEARHAVQSAPVKNVDETSWKLAGKLCWLWTAVTAQVACFVLHARRGAKGLTALLGEAITGIVCSDRWSAYGRLPARRRQLCWAHLKRDFQKCVDRGGAAAVAVGETGLAVVAEVFAAWHLFRGGGLDRPGLQRRLSGVAEALGEVLRLGQQCADSKVATFCGNVAALEPALWRFVVEDGVEPTNNAAERALRRAVLWRKRSFGSQSAGGMRFVERMLTVVGTLRLQDRTVLSYLEEAVNAHRAGLPAPKLLPIA